MRIAWATVLLLLFSAVSEPALANNKYAGFVYDADSGKVFYSDRADSPRYPASLTKMMTLYLTFDALRQGKIGVNTKMHASANAAKQPQTNISLRKGQSITVDQAIRALVVRSANDASVVLAEHLGGSVSGFAKQMTEKARELGMNSTTFKNPHGLPNRWQITTARDMSKLGAALRRDFPQYYHYFDNQTFTFNGKTFRGHNKVLKRFGGVDGIKTGYIRASGFNLVSSVKRDGYHIVAVVMGGKSSRSRDNHMVKLLETTFAQIQQSSSVRTFAGLSTPRTKSTLISAAAILPAGVELPGMSAKQLAKVERERNAERVMAGVEVEAEKAPMPVPFKVADDELSDGTVVARVPRAKPTILTRNEIALSSKATASDIGIPRPKPAAVSPVQTVASVNTSNDAIATGQSSKAKLKGPWAIQVGAFRDEKQALEAAARAVKIAKTSLKQSQIAISDSGSHTKGIHRARLANLSENQAKDACQALIAANAACFIFRTTAAKDL